MSAIQSTASSQLLPVPSLPVGIQQQIVSFLPFSQEMQEEHARGDLFCIEDLCRRTEEAFKANIEAIISWRHQFMDTLTITKQGYWYPSSYDLVNPTEGVTVSPFSNTFRWDNQQYLRIWNMPYSDAELEQLCTRYSGVQYVFLSGCNNLHTLRALSLLPNLRKCSLLGLGRLHNSLLDSGVLNSIPMNDRGHTKSALQFPECDFSALKLPSLETLSISCSNFDLRTLDFRKCSALKNLRVTLMGSLLHEKLAVSEDGDDETYSCNDSSFCPKVIRVPRGCEVVLIPNKIVRPGSTDPINFAVILRD